MKTSRSTVSHGKTAQTLPLPILAGEVSLSSLRPPTGLLSRLWAWIQARNVARTSSKRLRVAETVSLGEKRFVAVVQVDGRHFLLAGGPTNIALLAQLDAKDDFNEVLKKTMKVPGKHQAKGKRPVNHATGKILRKPATASRKPPAKPVSKPQAPAGAPMNAQRMAQFDGMETFDEVLQKTVTRAGTQTPVKQPGKVNGSVMGQTGHYA